VVEQPSLARKAAAEAGQGAVGADPAMTGDDEGGGFRAIGCADGTARSLTPELRGELAVADRRAGGNGAQGAPDFALERCAGRCGRNVVQRVQVPFQVRCERSLQRLRGRAFGQESPAVVSAQHAKHTVFILGELQCVEQPRLVGDQQQFADR
jgi:hypothetical protein